MKKIITFIICLALCVSGLAVGVVNQQAKNDSDAFLGAPQNALIGASDDAAAEMINAGTDVSVLSGPTTGENGEQIYTLPKDAKITITSEGAANHKTYQALLDAFNVEAVEGAYTAPETATVLEGNGATIITEIPLFDVIGNCTIQNLTVVADNNVSDDKVTPIELSDDDIFVYATNYNRVGTIAAVTYGAATFTNVTVNGGLSYSGSYAVVSMGGFVGARQAGNLTFTSCVNNSTINFVSGTNATGSAGDAYRLAVAGFIGSAYKSTATFNECVNTGNITVTDNVGVAVPIAAGFVGTAYGGNAKAYNSLNIGNVAVNVTTGTNSKARIGGFLGRANNGGAEYFINLGNITFTVVSGTNAEFRMGGIVGDFAKASTNTFMKNCLNAGDVVCTSIRNQPYGGLIGYTKNTGTYTNNISIGRVESAAASSAGSKGYIIGNPASASFVSDNCYYLPFNTVKTEGLNGTQSAFGNNQGTVAATDITTIFTTSAGTADGNTVAFKTSIAKDFYTLLKGIVDKVETETGYEIDFEFGGIVTLKNYDAKIPGDFTHDNFDTYLAEAKKNNKLENITSLYMKAKFDDGRVSQILTDAELDKDDSTKYGFNVRLLPKDDESLLAADQYIARTFIKIGNAYVYSTVPTTSEE